MSDEGLQTADGPFGMNYSPITADIRGRLSLEAPGAVFQPTCFPPSPADGIASKAKHMRTYFPARLVVVR